MLYLHQKSYIYENDEYTLHPSSETPKGAVDNVNNKQKQLKEYQEVIDVIAVIQEINAK